MPLVLSGSNGIGVNGINWALTPTSSGLPVTPNIPAFWASGSGNLAYSGAAVSNKLTLGTAFTNNGNHYNTSLSRFTAPVTGRYWLFMSALTNTPTSSGPALILNRNGSALREVSINYSDRFYTNFTGGAVIQATAGDFFEMFVTNYNSTSFTIELGRCYFMGYLIG
jgi:hypothetical protein